MWRHLHSNYTIQTDSTCKTSIHLLRTEHYTLTQLKQIACAIIHFEPVMCVLTNHHHHRYQDPNPSTCLSSIPHPPPPRRNYRDNPLLGARNPSPQSRTSSLALIASIEPNPKLGNTAPLIALINPSSSGDRGEYCWALQGIPHSGLLKHNYLPGCEGSEDAIRWAELTIAFIEGALACQIQDMERIRPDHEGLRAFMSGIRTRSDGGQRRHGSR